MPSDPRPIWVRPEPAARSSRLSRAAIARAALAIADRDGFSAVSMRNVAAELGVSTMSLYHYVDAKDDLVALMDDALLGDVLLPEPLPSGWEAAISAIARRTREVFAGHAWAVTSLQDAIPGPNAMLHFEQTLAALADLGATPAEKLELAALVDDYVFGHVIRNPPRGAPPDPATIEAVTEFGRKALATGRFPHTAAVMGGDPAEAGSRLEALASDEGRFERGLRALLRGFASERRAIGGAGGP